MIKRLVFCAALISSFAHVYSQGPKVPSKMTFADVRLKISESGRSDIQKEVDAITHSSKYFNAKVEKANIYFPMIERAFNEEGVPTDFKYLALQESALIPDAVSKSNAVGYWQFKDYTAVEVGMRVDKHIDERKNIYASSRGAARYMKKNNEHFDNWLYALQAYQMGAGAALKVLNEKNFGSKSLVITDKTYWYVKTFLAHKIAYEYAIGKTQPTIQLVGLTNVAGKTLHEIAKESKIDVEQLEHYNQWLKRGRIPDDRQYLVIAPTNDQSLTLWEGNNTTPEPVISKTLEIDESQVELYPLIDKDFNSKYPLVVKINGLHGIIAKDDDALRDLAKAGMLDIGKLLKYNDVEIDHRVISGQVYYIQKKRNKAKVYYHILAEGESLWNVSQKYGIRLDKLKMKNRIVGEELIKPGRVLWLRHVRPISTPIGYKKYKSQKPVITPSPNEDQINIDSAVVAEKRTSSNDTINLDSALLVNNNQLNDSTSIDEVEYEQVQLSEEPQSKLLEHVHIIKPGETLYRISKIYNVKVMQIVDWNSIDLTTSINPGEELIIKTTPENILSKSIEDSDQEKTKYVIHTVSAGETMYSIARSYGVSIEQLQDWNERPNYSLSVGDELKVIKPNRQ